MKDVLSEMHTFDGLGRLLGEPKRCLCKFFCDVRVPLYKGTVLWRLSDAKVSLLECPGDPPRVLPLTIFRGP